MSSSHKAFAEKIWSKMLHLYFRMSRGLTLGVRAVVINGNREVLLVKHRYTSGWHFPGGGVELAETVEQALARELEQETGLEMLGEPKLHGIFFNSIISGRDHVLVFLCESHGQHGHFRLNHEIAEVGFFANNELPDDIDPGTKRRIYEIINGIKPSEFW